MAKMAVAKAEMHKNCRCAADAVEGPMLLTATLTNPATASCGQTGWQLCCQYTPIHCYFPCNDSMIMVLLTLWG